MSHFGHESFGLWVVSAGSFRPGLFRGMRVKSALGQVGLSQVDPVISAWSFTEVLYSLLDSTRSSSAVRLVRLWPDHFFARNGFSWTTFLAKYVFGRAVFSRFF